MNKDLAPLEWLRYYEKIVRESNQTFRPNGLKVIENVLKDYEHSQQQRELYFKQAKELKELYKAELKNTAYYNNLALKYKKALEIINNKPIVALVDYKYTYEEWLELVDEKDKDLFENKEEYELLKEILK